jgi:hypothetical protein
VPLCAGRLREKKRVFAKDKHRKERRRKGTTETDGNEVRRGTKVRRESRKISLKIKK